MPATPSPTRTATPDRVEARSVAKAIARCPQPGLAVQAAGLLAMAFPDSSLALPIPDAWLQALPRPTWSVRREVLSVAYAVHPNRFKHRQPALPEPPSEVWINPPREAPESSAATEPQTPGQVVTS